MPEPTMEDLLAQVAALTETVSQLTTPKTELELATEAATDAVNRKDLAGFVAASRERAVLEYESAEYEDVA